MSRNKKKTRVRVRGSPLDVTRKEKPCGKKKKGKAARPSGVGGDPKDGGAFFVRRRRRHNGRAPERESALSTGGKKKE